MVQRVAHGRLTILKFYVNESQDECINMEELEGVIQRDLEKLKAGKKDYQGIGRTYRIRGNGVTSNVRIGDDLKSSRPPPPPRWAPLIPAVCENEKILKGIFEFNYMDRCFQMM